MPYSNKEGRKKRERRPKLLIVLADSTDSCLRDDQVDSMSKAPRATTVALNHKDAAP